MTLSLPEETLKKIANKIFLLKNPAPMKLPKPTNGPDSFTSKFASIATDPRYKDMGIGVIDFTDGGLPPDGGFPKIWLHNGDRAWRIGSTCKLAIHLAAVQLRDDVRQVQDLNIVSTATEFDQLFQMEKLWGLYKGADKEGIPQIAGPANAPQISTIFDFSKSPLDFIGPSPNTPNGDDIFDSLPVVGHRNGREIKHLTWETVGNFEFSELLWLAGAMSDNIAATACASQIGLPYIKALMRAYGLFDPHNGMYLQLSTALAPHDFIKNPVLVDNTKPNGAKYRPLTHALKIARVTDFAKDPATGKFTDHYSSEPGSAAALAAYMIALMQNKLVDPSSFMLQPSNRGIQGCETIRSNLAKGENHSIISYLVKGIERFVPEATVNRQVTKIGILGKADGERSPLICEFAYLETKELDSHAKEMKFAVIATGILGLIEDRDASGASFLSVQLGTSIHWALVKP